MLFLNRNKNQSIMIGKNIKITIIDVNNRKVCVGVSAPKDIEVYREELFKKIHQMKDCKPVNDLYIQEKAQ